MSEETKPLGIKGIDCLHFYVRDIDRMRDLLCGKLDFAEVGGSTAELEERGKQRSVCFEAGDIRLVVSQPIGVGGRAWRFLNKHPEGVGTLVFAVENIDETYRLLAEREGTFISDVEKSEVDGGSFRTFSITTPFGDTTFRFVQREGTARLYPGYQPYDAPRGGDNKYGFTDIDHITSNFQTMKPALLWMEHVMGFERYWDVEFHTEDVAQTDGLRGSGLKSVVMWDPHSGVKFANNEPKYPQFKLSQINVFNEDHRGDGIQHAALVVRDIIPAVRGMREANVAFMPTPGTYYDMLPQRIEQSGIAKIDEDIELLRELQILIDGDRHYEYLLQIFMNEMAGIFKDKDAGPFFFEIIQRKGDRGFGAGNFRALFESIERQQIDEGRI